MSTQLYVLTLSLVRIDVGALVSSSMSVYPLITLLLIRTGEAAAALYLSSTVPDICQPGLRLG